jgi:hypothetical protein
VYLVWFDDHPKREVRFKIIEAIDTYQNRFGKRPIVVLVNESQVSDPIEGINVTSRSYVRRHYFWVGIEQPKEAVAA